MKIFEVIRRICAVQNGRSKQLLNPNQHILSSIALYNQELSKELPRDFLKRHSLKFQLENKACISKIAEKMYEQNKKISIDFTGQSVMVTNQKSITKYIKISAGYEAERNLNDALKEHAKISQDKLVIFHSLDLFETQENKFVEKDFLIVNVSKNYIISIEAKKTLNKTKTRCAIDQLKSTKNILEQYFNSNLEISSVEIMSSMKENEGAKTILEQYFNCNLEILKRYFIFEMINSLRKQEWCFIPMVYCENLKAEFSGSSEMHIIQGKKLTQILT